MPELITLQVCICTSTTLIIAVVVIRLFAFIVVDSTRRGWAGTTINCPSPNRSDAVFVVDYALASPQMLLR